MEELTRELTHLGLTAKEASVYLAAMELGPSVAQDISKKAKVNRATTYVMIDTLKGRGLISSYTKGKKKYFVAESPDRLLSMIRLQRQELEGKEAEFAGVLPQLLALHNVDGAKPQVRFLEGLEGIKTVGEEMTKIEGEAIQIVPFDDVHDFVVRVKEMSHSQAFETVKHAHVPIRSLVVVKNEKLLEAVPKNLKNTEIRLLPFEKFPIHGEITIRKDRIVMFSYKSSLVSMVITSQILADTMRAIFELAWDGAKEYPTLKG
jgi:HTH-type transcriptional regulator, sugar sensing transcriptional regulator